MNLDITDRPVGTTDWAVVPVNLVRDGTGAAVMGKGLARWFALAYPELPMMFGSHLYHAGITEKMSIGGISDAYNKGPRDMPPPIPFCVAKYRVILLPTKHDWRNDASLDLISAQLYGLQAMGIALQKTQPGRILIPRLGCGLGGLSWETVKARCVLAGLDREPFVLCEP